MSINISNLPANIPTTTVLPSIPPNLVTAATYGFGSVDVNVPTVFNSPAVQTATISANVAPVGAQFMAIQFGTGQLNVISGIGATLFPSSSVSAIGQYSVVGFLQVQLNVWIAFGNFI